MHNFIRFKYSSCQVSAEGGPADLCGGQQFKVYKE